MVIRTERLTLEPWNPEDWAGFRPIATDPEILRYINGGIPWTDEQVQAFIGRQIKFYEESSISRWKMSENGRIIGFCGANQMNVDGVDEVELGWWVARDRWGQGFATEAARAALEDLETRCGYAPANDASSESLPQTGALEQGTSAPSETKRVISIIHVENRRSQAVASRIGMIFEKQTTFRDFPVLIYSNNRGLISSQLRKSI